MMGPYSPAMKEAAARMDTPKIRFYRDTCGMIVIIPDSELVDFAEVIRRGMAFEFGQSNAMHNFADELGRTVPPGTPLPGTMLIG